MDEAASIHSIIFASGKTLEIEFYYDEDQLTLRNYCPVENVRDLEFIFDRSTTHSEYRSNTETFFFVSMGEPIIEYGDDDKKIARFRIGPVLAHHLQEVEIEYQGSQKFEETPNHVVTIRVSNRDEDRDNFFDMASSISYCGSRGIASDKPTPQQSLILTEVAALFSPYFYNIFYRSAEESWTAWFFKCFAKQTALDEEVPTFVKVSYVVPDVLHDVIERSTLGIENYVEYYKMIGIYKLDWNKFIEILDHSKRFGFGKAFKCTLKEVRLSITKLDQGSWDESAVKSLLKISEMAGTNDLLEAFVSKFCLPECLEEWEKQHTDLMTPEFTKAIQQKMIPLTIACETRTKLLIRFDRGDVVCSLFNDIHPEHIADLLSLITGQSQAKGEGPPNNLPEILLPRELCRGNQRSCIFAQTTPQLYLIYIDRLDDVANPMLWISRRLHPSGLLLGVVVHGAQVAESANRGRMRQCAVMIRRMFRCDSAHF